MPFSEPERELISAHAAPSLGGKTPADRVPNLSGTEQLGPAALQGIKAGRVDSRECVACS
jgi:hypothetical protein